MYPLLPGLMKQDPDHRGPGKEGLITFSVGVEWRLNVRLSD